MHRFDLLDSVLREWQVPSEPPPTLNREVWVRIASGLAEPTWWEKAAVFLLRPGAVAATAVLAVAIGATLALQTQDLSAIDPHDAYVQSISPFYAVHLARH